jgi:hypothetical protein
MGFLPAVTIKSVLDRIQTRELVLPAIQREFVWGEEQICRLFDSLMRNYPIGSLLSWKVEPSTEPFRWYGFMRDYHEKNNRHCPQLDVPSDRTVIAVLDGQQRLSSLNVGLRGSYAERIKGGWTQNEKSYPKKRLYLNVLDYAPDNELGMRYDFRFMAEPVAQPLDGSAHWFPVYSIAEMSFGELMAAPAQHGVGDSALAGPMIGDLYQAVHNLPLLNFYEETGQDVEKVLDIFIRVNSGGEKLSYSDLLLSIATAQWKERDARDEIHGLVDDLNATGQGFKFSKDAILKSGLVLLGVTDIGFKVKNFNMANMSALEKKWDEISDALEVATGLLADFGLSDATLSADSVLIPVASYIERRGLTQKYRTDPKEAGDRAVLKNWVIRSLLKQGVWGSGLDTLLRDLRDAIQENDEPRFPAAEIEKRMAARGKALVFSPEEVDELLSLKYGAKRTYGVLAMLFPHVDSRNVFHIDHIFPRGLLHTPALKRLDMTEEEIAEAQRIRDLLPNLQLLEGPVNVGKSDQLPAVWARATYREGYDQFLSRNDIPYLPEDAREFPAAFEARKSALRDRLSSLLALSGSGQPGDGPIQ